MFSGALEIVHWPVVGRSMKENKPWNRKRKKNMFFRWQKKDLDCEFSVLSLFEMYTWRNEEFSFQNLHRITSTKLKAFDGTTFALTPLSGDKKC